MSTGYFAQVAAGVVTDVRRVTQQRIDENPDLYPGDWVEVLDMTQYPAIGWNYDPVNGLTAPPEDEVAPE